MDVDADQVRAAYRRLACALLIRAWRDLAGHQGYSRDARAFLESGAASSLAEGLGLQADGPRRAAERVPEE